MKPRTEIRKLKHQAALMERYVESLKVDLNAATQNWKAATERNEDSLRRINTIRNLAQAARSIPSHGNPTPAEQALRRILLGILDETADSKMMYMPITETNKEPLLSYR